MPEIDTPFGKIVEEQITVRRFMVDGKAFDTVEEARRERFSKASADLRAFAAWVMSLHGDIPEANITEVMPILRKIRDSGLDFAAMAAGNGGTE